MKKLNIPFDPVKGYSIRESKSETLFPAMRADIHLKGERIGVSFVSTLFSC